MSGLCSLSNGPCGEKRSKAKIKDHFRAKIKDHFRCVVFKILKMENKIDCRVF